MNSESGYFKLGIFVIAGVTLIVGGIVFFGAGAMFKEYITVETATVRSVEGLGVGADVKYNGVTMGKVSKIELAMWQYPDADPAKKEEIRRYVIVQLKLNRSTLTAHSAGALRANFQDAIDQGLRARMASSGLTGPPFIELVFLNPKAYPPPSLPWTPRVLVIPSAPSQMTEVVSNVTEILAQVKEADLPRAVADLRRLLNHADETVTQLNAREIQNKAVALIDEVRGTNKRVHQILDNPKIDPAVNSVAEDLPRISARVRDATAQVDDILRDPKTKEMLANLNDAAASASPAVLDARRILRELDALLSSQSQDLESIVANLRQVLQNTAAVTEEAKTNPSRMIFGQPPPHITPGSSK
jgi:ABC-type transporter Mla subunit MlaD